MTITNGKTQPPMHLADVTVKAVDSIGEHAAKEIESAAAEIRSGADIVAQSLEDLAHTIREHTIRASEQVSQYVTMTTHTLGIVRELRERVIAKGQGIIDGGESRGGGADSGDTDQTRREEESTISGAGSVPQRTRQSKPDADSVPGGRTPGAH
jgi:hypothetical protein